MRFFEFTSGQWGEIADHVKRGGVAIQVEDEDCPVGILYVLADSFNEAFGAVNPGLTTKAVRDARRRAYRDFSDYESAGLFDSDRRGISLDAEQTRRARALCWNR